MRKVIFILFFISFRFLILGQEELKRNKYNLGLMLGVDLSYNLANQFITDHTDRKLMSGLSYTDKNNRFILFGGVSFKVARVTIIRPKFTARFLKEVENNYFPILGNESDSVEAAGIYNNSIGEKGGLQFFRGIKTWGLQAGIILKNDWKINPTFQYLYGAELIEFYNGALFYTKGDKGGSDYTYSTIAGRYHLIKLGASIPFKLNNDESFNFNFSIGYKRINYGQLSLEDLPFSSFTRGNLSAKYSRQHNFFFLFH